MAELPKGKTLGEFGFFVFYCSWGAFGVEKLGTFDDSILLKI